MLIRRLAPYAAHLRLPFQLTLAPIFLWGALLSDGGWDMGTSAAFVALHLFLYPAATAFNAVYDRDSGPVATLAQPPEVPPHLLRFALALALIGALPAFAAGAPFLLAYVLMAGWTAAYSHPRTRWKASPWQSAAAIALGQGALGFLAGWIATAAPDAPAWPFAAGAAGAALTALGLYPATMAFQVAEDRLRGDRTLAVALGPARALRLGSLCLLLGGAVTAWLVARRFGPSDAALIVLGYLALVLAQERLARRPDYRRAMRLLNRATACFLLFLVLEAIGRG
jgi:1,4-dihydroxy-2-naphthoate octaprenyltransferase